MEIPRKPPLEMRRRTPSPLLLATLLFVAAQLASIRPAESTPAIGSPEELGGHLLYQHGCVGCHDLPGTSWKKNGPPLSRVASKINTAWLLQWLSNPTELSAHRLMPDFGLNAEQSQAIAAYLLHSSTPASLEAVDPTQGRVESGKALVEEIGCLACHSIEGGATTPPAVAGPNLSTVGSKTSPAWLFHWLKNPASWDPETLMPSPRLSNQEALDITAYLRTLKGNTPTEPSQTPSGEDRIEEGKELIEEKGCFGCHNIPGFEGAERIGSAISDWTGDDFVGIHQTGETEDLLVPQFNLPANEVEALVAAANKPAPTRGVEAEVAVGRLLVRRLNCIGCHTVERMGEQGFWGGDLRARIEDPGDHPPTLVGEGRKVQAAWLEAYLKEPSPIRRWLKVRMPTYAFADGEVEALVRYFRVLEGVTSEDSVPATGSVRDLDLEAGRKLVEVFQCASCHPTEESELHAAPDKLNLAPALSLVRSRLRHDWLSDWLIEPQDLAPGTRMPDYFPNMGDRKNVSLAYSTLAAPQNSEIWKWFVSHYGEDEIKQRLEDTRWVIERLQEALWNPAP